MDEQGILAELNQIQQDALAALAGIEDETTLQGWKVSYLGRTSPVMQVFSRMGQFSKELRPLVGQQANQVKLALEAALAERSATVQQAALT
ncbi:MAG TPA: phenylalanine--tRNA ligase subunit alpha, partial [Anaerolineaceae bacterium]|nr:phenylalanine--tRNA ligase subunit alpha [Anaerolineaceae bacterium]